MTHRKITHEDKVPLCANFNEAEFGFQNSAGSVMMHQNVKICPNLNVICVTNLLQLRPLS